MVLRTLKMSRILVNFLLIFLFSTKAFSEPVCSKFAYEEQLLEKMVRIEFNVEQMEKEIKNTNDIVKNSLEQLKQNWESVAKDYEDLKTGTKDVVDENVNRISTEIEEMKKERKSIFEDVENTMKKLKGFSRVPDIAFKARTPSLLDPIDNQAIVFTNTIVNTGNAYNNATGIFTAPIEGTYLFTCQICLVSAKHITFGIYIEDTLYAVGRFYEKNFDICFGIETTAVMTADQTASVKSWSGSSGNIFHDEDNHRWCVFSGTLIHK